MKARLHQQISCVLLGIALLAATPSNADHATARQTACTGNVWLDKKIDERVLFKVRCSEPFPDGIVILVDRLNKRSKRFPLLPLKRFTKRPEITGVGSKRSSVICDTRAQNLQCEGKLVGAPSSFKGWLSLPSGNRCLQLIRLIQKLGDVVEGPNALLAGGRPDGCRGKADPAAK